MGLERMGLRLLTNLSFLMVRLYGLIFCMVTLSLERSIRSEFFPICGWFLCFANFQNKIATFCFRNLFRGPFLLGLLKR